MRIGRARFADGAAVAVAHQGHWVRASALGETADDVVQLLTRQEALRAALERADLTALTAAGQALPEDDAVLLQPLVGPRAVVAVGLNYREHADEVHWEAPPTPLLFAKWPSSLSGPFDPIPIDESLTTQVDYEVELVAVIGRTTRDVPVEEALAHVAGYAVANDVSARDVQSAESQWTRAKSFDGFCPLGPWVTTADEVPDPQALKLSCTVNGERRQEASTGQMIHGVADLVAYVSRGTTLEAGDVILTGTPAGVAMAAETPQWLRPGDVVRSEVEGLGYLQNDVVARTAPR